MAAFDDESLVYKDVDNFERERLDWAMLRHGPIALFRKLDVLIESISWLQEQRYSVVQADCETCETKEDVLWAIGSALGFHRWPSPGLDGFNDDCRDIDVPHDGGFALVLHRFDKVAQKVPEFARHVLDIIAHTSWDNLLFGRRLLCLIRSEDPWIQLGPVGGHVPQWNSREWNRA